MPNVYRKTDAQIRAKVGDPFIIELECNPTTGYQWRLTLDESKVKLVDQHYQTAGSGVGSGGLERFICQPVKGGQTSIRATYKRQWETTSRKQQDFLVRISD
jgi:inhibitor of cysteine peptidase